jgi:hypothetical protein
MTRLMALYPSEWRARYEDEFLAILAERPLALADRFDIFKGALDARLRPQLSVAVRSDDELDASRSRWLGLAVMAGVVPWVATWVIAANGPIVRDGGGAYRDGLQGWPFAIVAVLLLVAGIAAHVWPLERGAAGAVRTGVVSISTFLLWSLAPWILPLALAGLLALSLFALLQLRAGRWPRWAAASMLATAMASSAFAAVATATMTPATRLDTPVFLLAAVGVASSMWLIVGGTLVLRPSTAGPRVPPGQQPTA